MDRNVEAIRRLGYGPLESRALYLKALFQIDFEEDHDGAAETFRQALTAAVTGGDLSQQARIYSQLVHVTGYLQRRVEEARGWQRLAEAALTARGSQAGETELVVHTMLGLFE